MGILIGLILLAFALIGGILLVAALLWALAQLLQLAIAVTDKGEPETPAP